MRTLYICKNCGVMMNGSENEVKNYCGSCSTKEKREAMDKANQEIKNGRKATDTTTK